MAVNKIERIDREIERPARRSPSTEQTKGLEAQKTEAENLQIVRLVPLQRLSPQSLLPCCPGAQSPADPRAVLSGADIDDKEENEDEE